MGEKGNNVVFSLRLERDMYSTVREQARGLGISANDFIRMALAKTLTLPGLVSRYGLSGDQTVEGSQEIDQLVTQVMRGCRRHTKSAQKATLTGRK